jgi:hypothetical protein
MKFTIASPALLGLIAAVEAAKHGHGHGHNHQHGSRAVAGGSGGSGGSCQFPTDAGLVAVTPNAMNAGWAMSPDQPCKPGNYCPYACPPGQVSMQWDPKATSYSYPMSMVSVWCLLGLAIEPCTDVSARTAVFTVTKMVKSTSHSLTSPTARMAPVLLARVTSARTRSLSVRLFCPATRPC